MVLILLLRMLRILLLRLVLRVLLLMVLLVVLLPRLVRSWSPGSIDAIKSQTRIDALGLADHRAPLGEVVCEAVEASLWELLAA